MIDKKLVDAEASLVQPRVVCFRAVAFEELALLVNVCNVSTMIPVTCMCPVPITL